MDDKPQTDAASEQPTETSGAERRHGERERNPLPRRTNRQRLDEIPQFEPDYSYQIHKIDFDNGTVRPFPPGREAQIDEILTAALPAKIKSGLFEGEPIGAARYGYLAKHAIAVFEHRKRSLEQWGRRRAKSELESALVSVSEAKQKLERLADWQEVSDWLKLVFLSPSASEFEPEDTDESVNFRYERAEALLDEFNSFSPEVLSGRLARLETVLELSIEKVGFDAGGDAQRDVISQEFCDEIAYAWTSGTGRIPTYPKPNRKSRNSSRFAALIETINDKVLPDELKQEFRYFGIRAVARMRRKHPELATVRRPSGASRR